MNGIDDRSTKRALLKYLADQVRPDLVEVCRNLGLRVGGTKEVLLEELATVTRADLWEAIDAFFPDKDDNEDDDLHDIDDRSTKRELLEYLADQGRPDLVEVCRNLGLRVGGTKEVLLEELATVTRADLWEAIDAYSRDSSSRAERRAMYREAYGAEWHCHGDVYARYKAGKSPLSNREPSRNVGLPKPERSYYMPTARGPLALDLEMLDERGVSANVADAIGAAPHFTSFAKAGRHLIECIHAIPLLHVGKELAHVELYIGRTGWATDSVMGRWRRHHRDKEHEHGLVALACDTAVVVRWEGLANKILDGLHERKRLCVANAWGYAGAGNVASTPRSVVYLTWRLRRAKKISLPRRSDIDGLANEVREYAERSSPPIPLAHVLEALDPLSRPVADRIGDLYWHPNHED